MSLSNYIRELLPEHDTVIIPGLGAFVSSYKSAEVDENSGEMIPPSQQVSFEPRIRNNDGLLAGKIAEDESIPLTEAYRKLEFEREEILYRLDKGETVTLEDIGELYYGPNREIKFYSSELNIFLPDTYGLEADNVKTEPEDIPEEQAKFDDTVEKSDVWDPIEEETPEVYTGASLNDSGIPPHKRNRAWWLLLFFIPVLAAAIYIITKDTWQQPSVVNIAVEEPKTEVVSPADTVTTDSVPVMGNEILNASSDIIDSTGFLVPDSTKFYLITGSYEEFKNADKYFHRLKANGFEPFHLGKHGSFYLVGIDTFNNEIEAYGQQYNYLDKHPESGAWIFIPDKKYIPYSEQNDTIIRQF